MRASWPRSLLVSAVLLLILMSHSRALGEVVDIIGVSPPERTMAGKPFVVEVMLQNRAEAPRTVVLLGALYAKDAAECGPATQPGFKQFTHLVQERVTLQAGERRVVRNWTQAYEASNAEAAPRNAEWCAFVTEDAGERLNYLDYQSAPLSVRGANARPTASFSWLPERPVEARDVWFAAEGADADDDPVTFRWDFGHANASGRRPAEGATPTHFFYPAGRYVVTLAASDGLEETLVTREVEVLPEGGASATTTTPPVPREAAPLPLILPLAALAAAAWARARRPRCR